MAFDPYGLLTGEVQNCCFRSFNKLPCQAATLDPELNQKTFDVRKTPARQIVKGGSLNDTIQILYQPLSRFLLQAGSVGDPSQGATAGFRCAFRDKPVLK